MTLLGRLLDRLEAIEALPPEVESCAVSHLMDIIGVGTAAATSAVGAPWLRYAAAHLEPDGPSTVLGRDGGAVPAEAALVNGGLMHSLEYDDTHTGSIVHGSAVLASAALAVAEGSGRSGARMIRSYALWYEVLIRIGLAAAGGFQARGYQVSSVGGALAAAGIAADLRELDRAGVANAIGIALSQASGVFAFLSNGATVKSMHPGWAAHAGIKAAELAEAGLTGPDRPFDDPFGLFAVFAGDAGAADRFARSLDDLGRRWHLPDVAYKFLPCCHYIHPFVEAAALLSDGVARQDIAEMRFGVPKGVAAIICDPWDAKIRAQGHSARWSLPVVTAMQLVEGTVGLDQFDRPAAPAVQDLAARSSWEVLQDSAFPARFDARLTLRLTDGRTLSRRVDDVFGNATRPSSEAEIRHKFETNMARLAGPTEAAALAVSLRELARQSTLEPVTRRLRATASAKEISHVL